MKTGTDKSRKEEWLDTAYKLLIQSGVDSVKILTLSKTLNTSRTSFYWCFKDRRALLNALIERWKSKNTQGLISQSEKYADSIVEAMLNVFDCWLDSGLFDSNFEFAVRNWAMQSPEVSQEVTKADQLRIEALTNMFIRFGYGHKNANVRARTIYLTQIGYISMQTKETKEERMGRMADYIEIFTGQPHKREDMIRFASRHTPRLAEWMEKYDRKQA